MDVTEAMLEERAKAPRVTLQQVNDFISSEHFFTAAEGADGAAIMQLRTKTPEKSLVIAPLSTEKAMGTTGDREQLRLLTICVLVLANGFTVLGKSACADPANYDPQIGRDLARKDAFGQIWPLLGFELRSKLAIVQKASPLTGAMLDHFPAETYLGTKVVYATPMTRGEYNFLRGWQTPAGEDQADAGYLVQYADGGKPNLAGFDGYVSWSPADVFERANVRMGMPAHGTSTIQ